MIWFDASLESPADDGLLQGCIATMLGISGKDVDVVHSIGEIGAAIATCVVKDHSAESYSQLVTLYISEDFPVPGVPEAAVRLALALDRSLLLVNDETANPYSFVRVSNTGQQTVVLVDPDELDENGRYAIREPGPGNGEVSA
jgi:hypothetical protein